MEQEAAIRRRLLAELAGAEEQLARLERDHAALVLASQTSNADDEHDPEGATIAFEREQLTAMTVRIRATAEALRRSLGELGAGTYGRCEQCSRPIDPARLEARPQARTCISCASATARRR